MMYNHTKGKKNFNSRIIILLILSILAVIIIFLNSLKFLESLGTSATGIYQKLINNAFPITYIANNKMELDHSGDILDVVLDKINIKLFNPFSIVGFEVPYFNMDKVRVDSKENFSILDSFSLNEGSVVKLNPEELEEKKNQETSSVFNPNLKKPLNNSRPEVLLYHTHTTEAYAPSPKNDNNDEAYNVVGVGNELVKELEKYGISVIHDKTLHSLNYDLCYNESGKTVQKYLNEYGNFKMIIDLHRDAGPSKENITTNINGENLAKIMLVNSRNSKYYSQNAALADKMNKLATELFPGLFKGIRTVNRGIKAYNQGLNPNATLIEVGANTSEAKEAQNSAKYIARIIAEIINGQK